MPNILSGWCRRRRVLINTFKSKCIHFRPIRHRRTEFQFKIGQSALETVDIYKYLGIYFHEHLDYSKQCDAIFKGAGRALGSIISKISNLKDFVYKSFEKLYFSCVVPVLQYGLAVWGFKAFSCLENIQYRTMRYFMGGVHRYAPVLALIGDVGWLPCSYRQWISIIRFWNRLI